MKNIYMAMAIDEAITAQAMGEMPVGAVIVKSGTVIAKGHNLCNGSHNPLLHAEVVAIKNACEYLKDWRLNECDLYVTLEPCAMCSGAIINSRVRNLYFGAYDIEYGAAGGRIDLFSKAYFGSKTSVYGGIMEKECKELIDSFFGKLRRKADNNST